MAANRKKGKKPQNSNQGKSSNKNDATAPAVPVSDNATSSESDHLSVDWATGAASPSDPPSQSETHVSAPSTDAVPLSTPPDSDCAIAAELGPASNTEAETVSAEETGNQAGAELSIDADSTAEPEPNSAAVETAEKAASEPNPSFDVSSAYQSKSETGASEAPPSLNTLIEKPKATDSHADASAAEPAEAGKTAETAETAAGKVDSSKIHSGANPETITKDSSAEVKLSTNSDKEAAAAPQPVSPAAASAVDVNFGRDEIRTLLVPVSPFNRLVACAIVIFSFSILGFIILKTPAGVNSQGMHTLDLADPGDYVFFYRGDTEDPYGWTAGGRFRKSLQIDMEPVEPGQRVLRVEPIKDLSGAGFFSVAEFEVNQPGKYNLWIKWNDPNAICRGKIRYEKDPVESFFFKWALGIVGTIALFYMVGIPMTTRKAQATLPNAVPPVVVNR